MKKNLFKIVMLLLFVLLAVMLPSHSAAAMQPYEYNGYTYDFWGTVKESPPMFQVVNDIDQGNMGDIPLQNIEDVHYHEGLIYIADSTAGRVNVFDTSYELVTSIRLVRDAEGKIALDENGHQVMLRSPRGIFVEPDSGLLYIADAEARAIFVLDAKSFAIQRVILEPDEYVGVTDFVPSKVAVDPSGRIYVVVMGSYEGIIELNPDGSFSRYFGVNSPVVNLLDYFWRSIATDAQKERMEKQFAPAFNNVTVDGEGFIFSTTFDSNAADSIFRLNGRGENVLREEGHHPVIGDMPDLVMPDTQFVDVSVTEYGVYAGLDRARGRIFLYDYDGYLLNVFGNLGSNYGQLRNPSAIAWMGDKLIVADRTLRQAFILEPTRFGAAALEGSKSYYAGDWETANEHFSEALRLNANYDLAYIGIGKNHLMEHNYEDAMYHFEKGNSREYYSSAYAGYRNERLQENFIWIFIGLVAVLAAIFISEYRYHRKEGKS